MYHNDYYIIGRVGASPPSRYAGAPLYIFLYMSSGDEAFLVPEGPRATGKRKAGSITSGYLVKRGRQSELDFSTCYKQALASVLRLTMWTTPVLYLVNAQ